MVSIIYAIRKDLFYMKKKIESKLTLNKETIANLREITGGRPKSNNPRCHTRVKCDSGKDTCKPSFKDCHTNDACYYDDYATGIE